MRNCLVFLFFVLLQASCFASMEDALNATCKITTELGSGSGVVYGENDDYFYIGTAAHVILDNMKALNPEATFFNSGFRSHRIKSEIVFWEYRVKTATDFAIIRIKKEDFKDYPHPKPVPFAEKDYNINVSDVIVSYGCPKGSWPTGWKGHVTRTSQEVLQVKPFPLQGRSGSAVFNEDATKILGIIIWRNGVCVSNTNIARMWERAKNERSRSTR